MYRIALYKVQIALATVCAVRKGDGYCTFPFVPLSFTLAHNGTARQRKALLIMVAVRTKQQLIVYSLSAFLFRLMVIK
jgi:hypothetical protein